MESGGLRRAAAALVHIIKNGLDLFVCCVCMMLQLLIGIIIKRTICSGRAIEVLGSCGCRRRTTTAEFKIKMFGFVWV